MLHRRTIKRYNQWMHPSIGQNGFYTLKLPVIIGCIVPLKCFIEFADERKKKSTMNCAETETSSAWCHLENVVRF